MQVYNRLIRTDKSRLAQNVIIDKHGDVALRRLYFLEGFSHQFKCIGFSGLFVRSCERENLVRKKDVWEGY